MNPAEIEARYEANARASGVSLDAFVRDYLINNAPPAPMEPQLSPEEWEKELDALFDSFPSVGPLPDEAFSRESIYTRENEW